MKIIFYREFDTIFYCQDKNASTTLESFLLSKCKLEPLVYFDYSCKYPSSINLKNEILNAKKQVFQFTIVRNTWDRVVSLYSMLEKQIHNEKIHPWFEHFDDTLNKIFLKEKSFENFVDFICNFNHNTADSHWQDQYVSLPFSDENFHVARFERLDNEFRYVFGKMGLAYQKLSFSSNSTKKERSNYRSFYNERTKNIIKNRYRKEIGIFGFKFL